jgi:ABC-type branched-subunit amino acid transport system ATPase component
MLEIVELRASYGRAEVVRGVTFTVQPGQVTAIAGPNGAGKSTLANAICGLHGARSGGVAVGGAPVRRGDPVAAARAGISLVPQGRRIFPSLTVSEHFDLAVRHASSTAMKRDDVLDRLPRLRQRLGVRARALSGGEQQMLAVARAVLAGPQVLVLDEATEGLSPAVTADIADMVGGLAATGTAVLLLEQNAASIGIPGVSWLVLDRGALVADPPAPAHAAAGSRSTA